MAANFTINSISFINFVIEVVKVEEKVEQEVDIYFGSKLRFRSFKCKFHLKHVGSLKEDLAFTDSDGIRLDGVLFASPYKSKTQPG